MYSEKNFKNNKDIKISVVVIAYNSEKYIIETLDSIKNQSFQKVELIISDDSSTDNTINLTKVWLNKNKQRFTECKIISNSINTGITANCNRGLSLVTGEYIKLVAADDILLGNCLKDLLYYSLNNKLSIAFSKVLPFSNNADTNYMNKIKIAEELNSKDFFNKSSKNQYKMLLYQCNITALGCFLKKDLIAEIGGYNEKYEMMEDYPFWVKVSSLGYEFSMLDKYTVKYRVRTPEIRSVFRQSKRYNAHYNNLREFQREELYPRLRKEKMWLQVYHLFVIRIAAKLDHESMSSKSIIFAKFIKYLSPLTVMTKLRLLLLR